MPGFLVWTFWRFTLVTIFRYPYGQPTPPDLRARSILKTRESKISKHSRKSEKSEKHQTKIMQQNYDFRSPIFRISQISLNMFWNFLLASLEMDLTRSSGGIGWPYGYQNIVTRARTVDCARFRTCRTTSDARNRRNLTVDRKQTRTLIIKKQLL